MRRMKSTISEKIGGSFRRPDFRNDDQSPIHALDISAWIPLYRGVEAIIVHSHSGKSMASRPQCIIKKNLRAPRNR